MCLEKEEQLVAIYETVFGSVVGCSKQTHANKHLGMQPDFGSDRGLGMSVFFCSACSEWQKIELQKESVSTWTSASICEGMSEDPARWLGRSQALGQPAWAQLELCYSIAV